MNWQVVSAMLLIYGILFIVIENRNAHRTPQLTDLGRLSYKTALIIGMFQLLSLVPGSKRIASTTI